MAELEEKSREALEFDIHWEEKARKILLICSAVGFILGTIIGMSIIGHVDGEFIIWMWLGIGFGGAVSIIPILYEVHKEANDRDFSFWFSIVIFFIFMFAGPIGLLIRILRMNYRIKKFENQLSEVKS